MPDYKEMYLTLFREVQKSIDILKNAQQKCEDIFISEDKDNITIISKNKETLK